MEEKATNYIKHQRARGGGITLNISELIEFFKKDWACFANRIEINITPQKIVLVTLP